MSAHPGFVPANLAMPGKGETSMSITSALSNAVSGLNAASRRSEVTAHNIANATTEGYARQGVSASQQVTGGRGAGVLIANGATRATDAPLTASRREAQGEANGSEVLATASRALADSVGGTGSLFDRISALETTLRGVSETPESAPLQERAVSAAGQVVSAFGEVSKTIETERTTADHTIARTVDEVNGALKEVETLNRYIGQETVRGGNPAPYEQQRDEQLDIVAGHMSIRLMPRDNGQVAVLTDKGVTLLDSVAHTLEFDRTNVVTSEMDKRGGTGALSGLSVDGVDITPGAEDGSVGGTIAGLFEVRDGDLASANTEVDALAADIIGRFEATGIAGADGRGLFTDAGAALGSPAAPGLAGRIALNERVDPAQGGESWRIRDGLDAAAPGATSGSDHATRMLDAMAEARITGGSLSRPGTAAGLAGDLGSLFETRGLATEDAAAGDLSRFSLLRNSETAAIGVDLDQELQNLILIEQAYGANAKVIQVADRLVQRLLEL